MLLGGLGYTAYAAQMLYLSNYLLYTCALLNGLGASLLWTGQGNETESLMLCQSNDDERLVLIKYIKYFDMKLLVARVSSSPSTPPPPPLAGTPECSGVCISAAESWATWQSSSCSRSALV